MSKYPKAPCVGEAVVWFPHGDTNQEPFAATIVSRLDDECITLYTLSPTGRREPMLNVKHVDNPSHDMSPQGLIRWGAWDLVGMHEERMSKMKDEADKSRAEAQIQALDSIITEDSESPDEIELQVIEISRELGEVPGRAQIVADKLGGSMTHQRVNSILRRFSRYLVGELPLSVIEGE